MKIPHPFFWFAVAISPLAAQTLYVPSGTSGIGNNTANGNVGIGISTPVAKLHVSASASGLVPMFYSEGAFPQWPSILENLSGGNTSNSTGLIIGLNLENSAASSGTFSPFLTFSRQSDSTAYNPVIAGIAGLYIGQGLDANWGTGALTFWTAGAAIHGPVERVRIDQNGNVGIGTTTPSAKLEVRGDIRTYRDGADTINSQIYFANAANSRAWNWQLTASGECAFWGYDGTSWGETIRVKSNGNVGIGTTSPTQKLSVNGTIRAKEVIVDTGWSDFVFQADYRLAPLSEVEGAIQKDGHLPGIPSAREVAEHGVSMGEMQSKLLAKIEELTLHVIAQEKRQAGLAQRVLQLEAENQSLRSHSSP